MYKVLQGVSVSSLGMFKVFAAGSFVALCASAGFVVYHHVKGVQRREKNKIYLPKALLQSLKADNHIPQIPTQGAYDVCVYN